ncbi:hypothetical protein [Clostridium isatidis]|nr:hypothetical protein [Clostridium isatidis]
MDNIKPLNQEINYELRDIEELIKELNDRNEFLCTGNVCGADVTLV